MKPITFSCSKEIRQSAESICTAIIDLERWPEFTGYGFLPGIAEARFDPQTANVVGSRIHVQNTDGSRHVEEIIVWELGQHVVLRFGDFSPPLVHLAEHFIEDWRFEPLADGATRVIRSFELMPKRAITRPLLWLISLIFRRAIDAHLELIASQAPLDTSI